MAFEGAMLGAVGVDGRCATYAEVGFLEVEVEDGDYLVACEVGSVVVGWVAYASAIGGFQDDEVECGDGIIIVGVACTH